MISKDDFHGCIIGSALGDAIGELCFVEKNFKKAVDTKKVLKYTDDTAMSIGIMEAILSNPKLDSENIGLAFLRNYVMEPWRGYAGGPPTVFNIVAEKNVSFVEACRIASMRQYGNESGSRGNGSAMRIAPIGAYFHDAEDLYEIVATSCSPTHIHPEAVDCSAVLAKSISMAATNKEIDNGLFFNELIQTCRTTIVKERMQAMRDMIEEDEKKEMVFLKSGMGGVEAVNSVPYAIYSFMMNKKSFSDTLSYATFGGDVDTIGAMACAISGAHVGLDGIPKEWMEKLENLPMIKSLCGRLYDKKYKV